MIIRHGQSLGKNNLITLIFVFLVFLLTPRLCAAATIELPSNANILGNTLSSAGNDISAINPLTTTTTTDVTYLDENGDSNSLLETDVTVIDSSSTDLTELTDGWYIVQGEVTISDRITTVGEVHLILADNCTLNAEAGITVNSNAALTIYAQSTSETTMGKLVATAQNSGIAAGIGGDEGNGGDAGHITIVGGNITATGDLCGAGIGGGAEGGGGDIEIFGGIVTATGGDWGGAGIGGGYYGSAVTIIINGGTVTATGGSYDEGGAAGIGGGISGSGNLIIINGGNITATAGTDATGASAEAIGSGSYGGESDVNICYEQGYYYYRTSADSEWIYETSWLGEEYYTGTYLQLLEDHFRIETSDGSFTYEDQIITITSDGTYTITGDGEDESAHIDYRIIIEAGLNVELTITNVKMSVDTPESVFQIAESNVTLYLEGENVFNAADTASHCSGIDTSFSRGQSLTITTENDPNGSLIATGSENAPGIGSPIDNISGRIIIAGGTITALGGDYAPGIGISSNAVFIDEIIISGGTVTATGGYEAAGIGGGAGVGYAEYITISGGTVTATGGGNEQGNGISCENIEITGGDITAIAGSDSTVAIGGSVGGSSSNTSINYTQGYYYYRTSPNGDWVYETSTLEEEYYLGTYLQLTEMRGDGHFTVETSDGTYIYEDQTITITSDGTYTVTGDGEDENTHSGYQIVVNDDLNVDIIVNNVKMSNLSTTPFDISGTATVTLYLEGDNIFDATDSTNAGIQFDGASEDTSLTITTKDDTDGSLTATGGGSAAGIGGGGDGTSGSASNITISGGTVTATGGEWAAGIGSGVYASASNIEITGGTVTATGGFQGAGIGGGSGMVGMGGDASNITITGGTVTATSTSYEGSNGFDGAGIGAGAGASANNITITGGTVTAIAGGSNADAIGSGGNSTGESSDIVINYTQGYYYYRTSTDGGWTYETASLGKEYYTSDYLQLAEKVGDGHFTVETSDGGFTYEDQTITIVSSGTYTITGDGEDENTHSGYQICINDNLDVMLTINNVKMSNSSDTPFDIAGTSFVYLYLEGTNTFTATGSRSAGIEFDSVTTGELTITTEDDPNGSLTATGDYQAAGIGGGQFGSTSDIEIWGGTVTATGGWYGAGIGGGASGDASCIEILGGTVTAQGGYGGAGIGGGGNGGDASYFLITGGTVTATGGDNAAGIGGGTSGGSASNIFIEGGTVTATGGGTILGAGAGIGGGQLGSASDITIEGGTVTAVGGDGTDCIAAGIGGGHGGSASLITISGGVVTAISSAEAIGSGLTGDDSSDITINYTDGYWYSTDSDNKIFNYNNTALGEEYYTGTYLKLYPNIFYDTVDIFVGSSYDFSTEIPVEDGYSTGILVSNDTDIVSVSDNTLTGNVVGTADVYAIVSDSSGEEVGIAGITVNVNKNSNSATVSITGWNVGESPNTPIVSATYGADEATYTYSDSETGTYSSTVPTTAGTWYVKATIAEGDSYEGTEAITSFTIGKGTPTVTFTTTPSLSKTYDGNAVSLGTSTVSVAGGTVGNVSITGDVSIIYYSKSGSDYTKLDSAPSAVGSYAVRAYVASDDNWKEAYSSYVDFTISQATPSASDFSVSLPTELVYDNTVKTATVTTSATGMGDFVIKYSTDNSTWSTSTPKDVGTYYVMVSVSSGSNYTACDVTDSDWTFTIIQATNSWVTTPSIAGWVYGGTASTPVGSATWGEVEFTYSDSKTGSYTTEQPTTVGTYYMKATVEGTANYTGLESDPIEFVISQASSSIAFKSGFSLDKTYDGSSVTVTADNVETTGSGGAVSFVYYKQVDGGSWEELGSTAPSDAGTYKVIAKLAADSNYSAAESGELTFTISKATNVWTITLVISDWTYGDEPNSPIAVAKFGTEDIIYTYSSSASGTFTEDVPSDAGTWYVKATINGTANYTALVSDAVKFTILKADSTITITTESLDKTYDGNAVSDPVTTTTGSSGDVSFSYYELTDESSNTWEGIGSAPVNAGSYKVVATVASDDNYNEATSAELTFTISQATPSVSNFSVSLPTELVYDDTVKTASATTSATGMGDFVIKYSTDNSTWSTSAPKDVGTYYVMVSVNAGINYTAYDVTDSNWTFTITQATNSWVTTPSITGWVYGGTASTPVGSAIWGEVEFIYSDSANGTYIADQPTTVGTWYMKATVEGTANYTGLESDPIEFIISQASSNISFKSDFSLDKTYDGSSVTVTADNVETTGSGGAVSFVYYKQVDGGSWEELGSTAPSDAGTYKVVAKLAADSNYSAAESGELIFTISKATNVWTTTLVISDWTYGDEPNSPIAVAKFGTEDIIYTYSSSASGTFTEDVPSDAGTYYVKATINGTANYTTLVSDAIKFTILKADSTITITTESLDKIYDGVAVSDPVTTTTGSSGTVSFAYYELIDEGNNTWEGIGSAPVNAGSYKVVATVASDNNYNEATSTELQFTISKATPVVSNFTVSLPTELVYDDTAKTATATTSATGMGEFVIKYSTDNSTWSSSAPKDVGTYYVMVSVSAGSNYTAYDVTDSNWTFTITQATNSWVTTPSIAGWVYGGTASTPAGSATWGEVEFTYSDSKTDSYTAVQPTTVGTWYMKATVEGTENYTGLESDPIEFIISQASSSIAFKSGFSLDKTYDGSSVTVTTENVETTGSTGEISFVYYEQVDGSNWEELGSTAPSDAGTYKVVAKLAADTNYSAAESSELTFTISKATNVWTTTLSIRDWTYGDEPNTPIAVAKFGTEDIIYTYSSSASGTFTENVPSDAGTWYVKATINGTKNYTALVSDAVKFTISKADSTITITTESLDKTYDGVAVSDPETTIMGSTGDISFIYYELTDEVLNTWEKTDSAPVNVGSYKVIATVDSDNNYNAATSDELEFIISKATPTASNFVFVVPSNTTYDGDEKIASVTTAEGINGVGDITVYYSVDGENWSTTSPITTGTYYVAISVGTGDNYKATGEDEHLTSENWTFTISKAENTWEEELTITGWTYGEYDAEVNTPSAVASFGEAKFVYSASEDGEYTEDVPTEAGAYYVKATVEGTDDYTGLESAAVKFTISKATLAADNFTFTGPSNTTYDGDGKTASVTSNVSGAGEVTVYYTTDGVTWSTNAPTDAGVYTVGISVVEGNNYSGTPADTYLTSDAWVFTITQATNEWLETLEITGWTYGETANQPSATAKFGKVVFTYSDSEDGEYTSTVPTEAGTYYVKATVEETSNYTGLESKAVKFVISRNSSSITITDESAFRDALGKTYDGQPVGTDGLDEYIEVTGSSNEVVYVWEYKDADGEWRTMDSAPVDAGEYRVTVTVEADTDYSAASSDPIEFTIEKSTGTVITIDETEISDALSKEYDGEPVNTDGLDVEVNGSTSTPTFKWEYKDGDGNWVETNDVPTDAGDYRVTVIVPGDDNYEETSVGPIEFTIEKSTGTTVTVNETEITVGLSKEYDGEPVNTDDLNIKVDGSSADPTFKWEYWDGENWIETNDAPSDPGSYRVTIIIPDDDNYEGTSVGPIEFTISEATEGNTDAGDTGSSEDEDNGNTTVDGDTPDASDASESDTEGTGSTGGEEDIDEATSSDTSDGSLGENVTGNVDDTTTTTDTNTETVGDGSETENVDSSPNNETSDDNDDDAVINTMPSSSNDTSNTEGRISQTGDKILLTIGSIFILLLVAAGVTAKYISKRRSNG